VVCYLMAVMSSIQIVYAANMCKDLCSKSGVLIVIKINTNLCVVFYSFKRCCSVTCGGRNVCCVSNSAVLHIALQQNIAIHRFLVMHNLLMHAAAAALCLHS
jgi:hypothetical protein